MSKRESEVHTLRGESRDCGERGVIVEGHSEIEVRRFSGRRHSPCGGLDDSVLEA